MLGLFSAIGQTETDKDGIILHDATFKKDFGPFKEGEKCDYIRVMFKPFKIQEIGEDGNVRRSQELQLITANNMLKQIIEWLDDDSNPETLFTKDGRKTFRFYSGTMIDNFLRALHNEVE